MNCCGCGTGIPAGIPPCVGYTGAGVVPIGNYATGGIPHAGCDLIDSEVSTLEAAKGLGISTVLLKGSALIPEGFPHPVINSFAELFRPSDSQPDPKNESEILDSENE